MAARRQKGYGRLTAIDKLPKECGEIIIWAARELSKHKQDQQDIFDQFCSKCEALKTEYKAATGHKLVFKTPSRSAFFRYSLKQAAMRMRIDEARSIAESLARSFDAKASDDLTMLGSLAIKSLVNELLMNRGEAGMEPKEALALAGALFKATQAENVSTARRQNVEKQFAKGVKAAVSEVAKIKGVSKATSDGIIDKVLFKT